MRKIASLIFGLAAGLLTIHVAQAAQDRCAPRTELVKVLASKYQESQQALGLISEKALLEIFASAKGTWTLVVTNTQGVTCVIAYGEAWDQKPVTTLGPSS